MKERIVRYFQRKRVLKDRKVGSGERNKFQSKKILCIGREKNV